jgi:hypothetical protein
MQENDKQLSSIIRTSKKKDLLIQELVEKLSAPEHEQWVQYSKSVYKQIRQSASIDDLIKKATDKWSSKWKPYDSLSESEKDKDRIWANKVLKIIRSNKQSLGVFLPYKTSTK